jgi:hypothetical protein
MTIGIRDPGGFFAGLLFVVVGLGAIGMASDYAIGTSLHMGPGYFPIALGTLLVAVGVASVARALVVGSEGTERIAVKPLLVIGAAVVVFACGIDRIGLVPTVFVSAFLACMAGSKPRIPQAALIAAVLSILASGIFYYGLKLPFSLF